MLKPLNVNASHVSPFLGWCMKPLSATMSAALQPASPDFLESIVVGPPQVAPHVAACTFPSMGLSEREGKIWEFG